MDTNNIGMNKILIIFVLLTLIVGCTAQKVSHTTIKRGYKENRYEKMFQRADSMFNVEYILR